MHSRLFTAKSTRYELSSRLSDDELIDGLRQYIRKNTKLPAFLRECGDGAHNEHLDLMLAAIRLSDSKAGIFQHERARHYLIYLIETKQIPFWEGISVYQYLTALQLYGSNNVNMRSLVNKEEFSTTEFGCSYLQDVVYRLAFAGVEIDISELAQIIFAASGFEQMVLCVTVDHGQDDARNLLDILSSNIPFISRQYASETSTTYIIPSFTLMNYIFSKMNPNPMQGKPIFGTVSLNTLRDLHQRNQHPLALSLPDVASNVIEVHGFEPGAFAVLMHDVAHLFGANLLSDTERSTLFEEYVSVLDDKMAENQSSHPLIQNKLQDVIDGLIDFDFVPLERYRDKGTRLQNYILHILIANQVVAEPIDTTMTPGKVKQIISDYMAFEMKYVDVMRRIDRRRFDE